MLYAWDRCEAGVCHGHHPCAEPSREVFRQLQLWQSLPSLLLHVDVS